MSYCAHAIRTATARTPGQLVLASLMILTAACSFAAPPIDLTGRDVLFSVSGDSMLSAGGKMLHRVDTPANTMSVPLVLSAEQAKRCYGLLVPGAKGVRVSLDGRPLDRRPLQRSDGLLFQIMDYRLHEGMNTVTLRAPEGAELVFAGTIMFSLTDAAEEDGFPHMFGEPAAPTVKRTAMIAAQADYDVLWYDCSWTPSMTGPTLGASSVTMGAQSLNSSLQTIILDFDANGGALVVDSVDGGPGTPTLTHTVDTGSDQLLVTLPANVPAGAEFRVRVNYHGSPSQVVGRWAIPYNWDTHGSPVKAVVYTFSEPYGARTWWPCKDIPEDKATTTVQRISVPTSQGWEVVSNGKLATKTTAGGMDTWVWQNGNAISTYLVSMCISNYIYVSSTYTSRDGLTTMPIKHAIFPENLGTEQTGAAGTLQVMDFFADTFGEYPFLDEKYFTASHTDGSGMEHQTCTSMPGGDVQDGMQRRNVHELSHQWYGDMITCANFDEIWLNEGFGTYAEALFYEHQSGSTGYLNTVNDWSPSDASPIVPAGPTLPYNVVYHKAAWVLHMLRHVIGDAAMFKLLKDWAGESSVAYGTAVTADFVRVAEASTGRELSWFFDEWLYRTNRPRYSYGATTHASGGNNFLDLTVNQTQTGGYYVMPVDIQMTDAGGATQTIVFNNAAVASETQSINVGSFVPVSIAFDPNNWVLNNGSLSINTCALPPATSGVAYSRTMTASLGRTSYTWSVISGSLPPGMSLTTSSSTGVLSGTCSVPGAYPFTVQVRDRNGVTRTAALTLDVRASAVSDWNAY